MAVELRNRLQSGVGRPLPSTLTFEYPTIEALTTYLATEVFGLERPVVPEPRAAEPETGDLLDAIENLADEDVDRLLARRTAGDA